MKAGKFNCSECYHFFCTDFQLPIGHTKLWQSIAVPSAAASLEEAEKGWLWFVKMCIDTEISCHPLMTSFTNWNTGGLSEHQEVPFHGDGNQALLQFNQGSCKVSILEDIQKLATGLGSVLSETLLEHGVGPDNLWSSFPTWTILWFYNSFPHSICRKLFYLSFCVLPVLSFFLLLTVTWIELSFH